MMGLGRLCRFGFLGFLVILMTAAIAQAGMDVSLEREFLRLRDIQERMESLPAYRQSQDLKQQMMSLQQRIEELAPQNPEVIEAERRGLQKQIDELQARLEELQKVIVDFREQTSRGERERFFPDVRHRIAAFTFDDPHDTGLGDAILFLLSKKLLFSARVPSFAIVSYRQGADRRSPDDLAYFDRIDAITQDQKFLLAVWGRVSRTETGVRIQSFVQVPADADRAPFVQSVQLPKAMGGGRLTARLKPNRIMVQSLDIDPAEVEALKKAATNVALVRAKPSTSAKVVGRLKDGAPYRIVDSKQDWVRLSFKNGGGWTSIDRFCTGICRQLLDVAVFTNDMVALTAGSLPRPVPANVSPSPPSRPVLASLAPEAEAISRQLSALTVLASDPQKAAKLAKPPKTRSVDSSIDSARFANLHAVARIAAELQRARSSEPDFNRIRLERGIVENIAQDLAKASVAYPADVEIVENLAVLFSALGDEKRRNLALEIATSLKKR